MDEQQSLDSQSARARAVAFCQQYGLRLPILQAPYSWRGYDEQCFWPDFL